MQRYYTMNADLSRWPELFEKAVVWCMKHGGGSVIVPDMGFVKWCVLGGKDDALTSVTIRLHDAVGVRLATMGSLRNMDGPAVIVLAAASTEPYRVEKYAKKAHIDIENIVVIARVNDSISWSRVEDVTILDGDLLEQNVNGIDAK